MIAEKNFIKQTISKHPLRLVPYKSQDLEGIFVTCTDLCNEPNDGLLYFMSEEDSKDINLRQVLKSPYGLNEIALYDSQNVFANNIEFKQ
jgi:hypothetical protein